MHNKFKLAVFDIAGTTVRDKDFVAIAFIEAFMHYGIELKVHEIAPLMGFKKTEAIEKVLEMKGQSKNPSIIDDIHNHFVNAMVSFYSSSSEVEPLPGAEEIFKYLQDNGIAVALNSGFPRVIVDAIVDRMGWMDNGLINASIASDEVEMGRPYPLMINKLMIDLGVSSSAAVIKTGDTMVDIQEGRMAGCGLVIGIATGAYTHDELAEYAPDHIINNLMDLKQLL